MYKKIERMKNHRSQIILILALLFSIGLSFYFHANAVNAEEKYNTLSKKYESLSDSSESYESQIQTLTEENKKLSAQAEDLNTEKDSLSKQISDLENKNNLLTEQINSDSSEAEISSNDNSSDNQSESATSSVWISATGHKYHRIPDCGNMNPNKATKISKSSAEAQGYTACHNCF